MGHRSDQDLDKSAGEIFVSEALKARLKALLVRSEDAATTFKRVKRYFDTVPEVIADTQAGFNLSHALDDTAIASAMLMQEARHSEADIYQLVETSLALLGAYNRVSFAFGVIIEKIKNEFETFGSREAEDLLLLASRHIEEQTFDVQWLQRVKTDASGKTGDSTDRVRRMRSRRKAGYRMVTVPIHKTDVETLHYLGLLDRDDFENSTALEDAAMNFTMAAFTVTSRGRVQKPGFNADGYQIRNTWLSRLTSFMQTSMHIANSVLDVGAGIDYGVNTKIISPIKEIASKNGYKVGVDGSTDRGIKLIAVQSTAEAPTGFELLNAIVERTPGCCGVTLSPTPSYRSTVYDLEFHKGHIVELSIHGD